MIICGYLLLRSGRLGWVYSSGLMLVTIVILSPVVQPWYLIWGLGLLACAPAMPGRRTFLMLAAVTAFIGLPGGWMLQHTVIAACPLVVAALAAALAALTVRPLGTWSTASRRPWPRRSSRPSGTALGTGG